VSRENLLLKWGTLKGWSDLTPASVAILQRYADIGYSMSAAMQHDSEEQKTILCELIDQIDGTIRNDWSGEDMTAEQAKAYVLEYGKPPCAS